MKGGANGLGDEGGHCENHTGFSPHCRACAKEAFAALERKGHQTPQQTHGLEGRAGGSFVWDVMPPHVRLWLLP